MKSLSPYLFFNGNCKKAMEFYSKVLGGELRLTTVADTKQEMFKDANPDLVMHAHLKAGAIQIMASDNMNNDTTIGDSVCMIIECLERKEVDRLFSALSDGGEITMKPHDTFWGAYFATVTDQFKNNWMFNFEKR